MKVIALHLPESYIKGLDSLVQDRMYASRSAAIRAAIHDLLGDDKLRRLAKCM